MGKEASSTAKTVDKALQIMESLASADREVGITQISRNVKINKSTVQRVVNTLYKYGYLQQSPHNKGYKLGFKFLEFSNLILQRIDLRLVARPFLEELRDRAAETVHLMTLDRGMGIYLDAVESRQGSRVVSNIGSRDDLHASAVGKALLAFLSDREVDEFIRHQGLKAKTCRTITDPKTFRRQLRLVRRLGYAIDDEEVEIGTRCVGVPIFDHTGHVTASISIAAPAHRLTRDKIRSFVPLLLKTSTRISQSLGRGTPSTETIRPHDAGKNGTLRGNGRSSGHRLGFRRTGKSEG